MGQEEEKLSDTVVIDGQIIDEQEQTPSRKSKSAFLKGLLWGSAFSLTAIVSAIVGATAALYTPLALVISDFAKIDFPWSQSDDFDQVGEDNWVAQYSIAQSVNILVMGIDRVPDAVPDSEEIFDGHSDTMLLLRFDPQDKSVKMLSIPRDTRIENQELTIPKINQANADGGANLAAQVVSNTLNDITIHRYLRINNEGLKQVIDLLGGVKVYVPQRMEYQDVTQNLTIDLQPGWQTLNGEQTEQFVRFRGDNKGDIGRVQRQQMIIKAMKDSLKNPLVWAKLPEAIRVMQQYIDTNLTSEEILALLGFSLKIDQDNVNMILLPGRFSYPNEYELSYWIMDQDVKNDILKTYFDQNPSALSFSSTNNRSLIDLGIAIQNTTGVNGLATSVFQHLRRERFTNCYFLNDSELDLETTKIIAQKGNFEAAKMLQEILGLGEIDVSATGDLDSDLTIRVGRDWSQNLTNKFNQ